MEEKKLKKQLKKAEKELRKAIKRFEKQEGFPEISPKNFEEFWAKRTEYITPFVKKVGKLNDEYRRTRTPKMKGIDSIGDLFTFEKFKSMCACGGFIDYDGYGYYATETEQSDIVIYPSDFDREATRDDFTHVLWYNR